MLIGISGKRGSGKDTLADLICQLVPEFKKKSYAYKLKKITALLTGTTLEQNLSREGKSLYLKEWDMTLGRMQQVLGTEAIRNNLHSEAWVLALFADYKSTPIESDKSSEDFWVVSDVRFPNEAKAIKERGGWLIRIDGDPTNIRKTNNDNRDANHPSEIALDDYKDFDDCIINDGTIEDLVNWLKSSKLKSYIRELRSL